MIYPEILNKSTLQGQTRPTLTQPKILNPYKPSEP